MSRYQAKEVIPGLILGGLLDLEDMLKLHPDVLVPLDRLPGIVWDMGFRGEILYCPIVDYSILPDDVLDRLVEDILTRLEAGKRIAVFCIGGHGRTGYVASCVLAKLGYEEPVRFVRKNYSQYAVESLPQYEAIMRFVERHKG